MSLWRYPCSDFPIDHTKEEKALFQDVQQEAKREKRNAKKAEIEMERASRQAERQHQKAIKQAEVERAKSEKNREI